MLNSEQSLTKQCNHQIDRPRHKYLGYELKHITYELLEQLDRE